MKISLVLIIISFCFLAFASQPNFRKGIFLTHSTGLAIWGPNGSSTDVLDEIVRYNALHKLSVDSSFNVVRQDFPVTPWTNEWDRWHNIFDGKDVDADITPFFSSYEFIMIKSCFPSSALDARGSSVDTLTPTTKSIYNYKWHWRSIIRKMQLHPENFFVIWTNAPLVAGQTTDNSAILSDSFCCWAKDTLAAGLDAEFGKFPSNVYVFDFFHKLAGADGKLPLIYAVSNLDSHPNAAGTTLVDPILVSEVLDAETAYENKGFLPVELTSFIAKQSVTGIELRWVTATEVNFYSFEIEKKQSNKDNWQTISSIKASGNKSVYSNYSFTDKSAAPGQYNYRLRIVDNDGTYKYSNIVEANVSAPDKFMLGQNYPNPFNPGTIITYSLPTPSNVKIILYNTLGLNVKVLANEFKEAGNYSVNFNASGLSSGIYFYKLEAGQYSQIKKMILLK
jgi:hypothetical protein